MKKIMMIAVSLVFLVSLPFANVSASVAPYAGGSGLNPVSPIGFTYTANGDNVLLDQSYTTTLPVNDAQGNKINYEFKCFIKLNPSLATNADYIVLYRNGVKVDNFKQYIIIASTARPKDGKNYTYEWRIPIQNLPLESGVNYEFKLLRGLQGNNGVTLTESQDIANPGWLMAPFDTAEQTYFDAHKFDVYTLRTGETDVKAKDVWTFKTVNGISFGVLKKSTANEVTNLPLGQTAAEFLNILNPSSGFSVVFRDKLGNLINESDYGVAPVGTNSSFEITSAGVSTTYTNVIYGDINGDAVINAFDLITIKKQILRVTSLSGSYLTAAKISKGAVVTIGDLLSVKKHILQVKSISQG